MYVHTIIVYFTSYSSKSNFMVRVIIYPIVYDNNNYASSIACILVCYIYLNYYIVLYSVMMNLFLFC